MAEKGERSGKVQGNGNGLCLGGQGRPQWKSNFNWGKNIMRKFLVCLFVVVSMGIACQAVDAKAKMYSCVRPDGGVVCTIKSGRSDPSVQCNRECLDCNMVCTAQRRVLRDGARSMTAPGQSRPGRRPESVAPGTVETPSYCRHQYANCASTCRSNPNNTSHYDREACISSCKSVRSGCGRRP
jgi:hypothetical protein